MKVEPVVLEGEFVRLEPVGIEHVDALWAAGSDEALWGLIPTNVASRGDMRRYVMAALADRELGVAMPFATIARGSGDIVGSTRFCSIDTANRRAEIGWTWITPKWQRTAINTEAKLLMLTYAFETWKCIRVELKTDALNERSRNAILRIGAKQEGIFRKHMITETGRFRDSVYFSIIDTEWDDVKQGLVEKLEAYR